ncbi:hypothetical protein [Paraburkholderia sediminicola]|uniref:hypothetical protein n=1 Tax=Paraburkholderia sediminicola TaxID=458836 RepID=UPI0038B7D2C7
MKVIIGVGTTGDQDETDTVVFRQFEWSICDVGLTATPNGRCLSIFDLFFRHSGHATARGKGWRQQAT